MNSDTTQNSSPSLPSDGSQTSQTTAEPRSQTSQELERRSTPTSDDWKTIDIQKWKYLPKEEKERIAMEMPLEEAKRPKIRENSLIHSLRIGLEFQMRRNKSAS